MNERIRELYAKATAWALHNYPPPVNPFKWEDLRSNKFAEFIAKECLVQIGEAIPDTNCSASGAYKTARIAATSRVKQHFGVE